MSVFSDSLAAKVDEIVRAPWKSRNGQVVPQSEDITLGNDRVVLDAVLLYADLADSTEMAIKSQMIAAEVFKSYLWGVTKIIQWNGGEVRSFDGDRVMGIFIGDSKNTSAALAGLHIHWYFDSVVSAQFKEFYTTAVDGFNFDQTVGIDRSEIHVARAGVRDNNDLIWVGRAPNVAAKLSAIRDPRFKTLISADVYSKLASSSLLSPTTGESMWDSVTWEAGTQYSTPTVYGSNWWVRP